MFLYAGAPGLPTKFAGLGSGGGGAPVAPTAINKSLGDASGGTVVIITHPNTTGLTGATVCGVALTSFSIVDSTHVQGTTGAMTASATPGDVVVTNASGDSPALASVFEAFWPTNLTSCTLWLRADLGVTVDGSSHVTAWADGSSAANNAAGSGTWTVAASWSNGKPALLCDGTTALTGLTPPTTSGGACTYLFVGDNAALGAGGNGGNVFTTRPNGTYLALYEYFLTGTQYVASDGVGNVSLNTPDFVPFANPVHFEWSLPASGGGPVHTIAGVNQPLTGTLIADTGTGGYAIGANVAVSLYWSGHFAEIVAVDGRQLTGPEMARWTAYVLDRYGLAA